MESEKVKLGSNTISLVVRLLMVLVAMPKLITV